MISLCASFLSGCTTVPTTPGPSVTPVATGTKQLGVYHKVEKGQTIWRIAKAYNMTVEEVVRVNNIPDVAKIEENQLIFIPGAETVKEIKMDVVDQNDFIWPIHGRVKRYFKDVQNGEYNKGIDIEAKEGEAVKSSRGGTIVLADYLSGYGYTVMIDHKDGFYTVYAQNAKLLVNVGENVAQNTNIAYVGKANDLAYLHFEVRKNTREDNPLYYLP